jgi:hypothetical protein
VRRQSLVAGVVLTAALVTLVALPGAAGSQTLSSVRPLTADAFQPVRLPASVDGSPQAIRPLDAAFESAGHLDGTAALIEPGNSTAPASRPAVKLPAAKLITVVPPKPKVVPKAAPVARPDSAGRLTTAPKGAFRRMITGLASWYNNGTTAMRLPYGTHVTICGARACITTIVRDWGPARYLGTRIVDMTPADFTRVTGRNLRAGLAMVKVYIY